MMNPRLLRITTVPISLKLLLEGQFNFFQQQGFEVLTASADGPEVEYLRLQGVAHQVVPMTRMMTPVQDVICLVKLVLLIRKFRPDIVHTHTPKAGLLGMMAAWICRVPVRMHTVAGMPLMESTGWKKKILMLTERITYACAQKIYPNSKGLQDFIHASFVLDRSKFRMIGRGSTNGIDSNYFKRTEALEGQAKSIREQFQITESEFVFCFVGRLVKDKGLVELVNAFQRLTFSSRLLLVGSFEEHLDPLPEEVMRFLRNDSRVILAGFQQDVRPWMIASDIFVFPSYREGFPNVVMQAACLELPSIVSDINGCNEIVQQGDTGMIVPVKNSDALLEAMVRIKSDETGRKKMAGRSREFVVVNFERSYVWGELLKEYRDNLII